MNDHTPTPETTSPAAPKGAVAPFTFSSWLSSHLSGPAPTPHVSLVAGGRGLLLEGLLDPTEVAALRNELEAPTWIPVGLDGIASHYRSGDQIGSWRASAYSPELAGLLWERLKGHLHLLGPITPQTPTDHLNQQWEACGINPLLRGIRYLEGGLLVPHYDAPYVASETERTLMTVVLYLGKRGQAQGGQTRFLHDPQEQLPLNERDLSDRTELARPEEIIGGVDPTAGSVLLFWHRVLHDSEPITGSGEKTIFRTDVTYRRA